MTEATVPAGSVAQQSRLIGEAVSEVKRVIFGQEHMVETLMVSLLAGGHCLLEGVPGVAKTLAVRTLSSVVGGSFVRIHFTPDLVTSDILGNPCYRPPSEAFCAQVLPNI